MNKNRHIPSELTSAQYYEQQQYSSIAQTIALIEAESFNTSGNITNCPIDDRPLPKKIVFSLGAIAILLLLSVIQLHQSLNLVPNKLVNNNIDKKETFISNAQEHSPESFKTKTTRQQNDLDTKLSKRQLEILTIKNAVSHGKF